MDAEAFVAAVSTSIVLCTLLISGVSHLARPHMLVAALRMQGMPGRSLPLAVSAFVISAEVALPGLGLWGVTSGQVSATRISLIAAAALLALYSAWTAVLLRAGSTAPCGCMGHADEINLWVPLRATILGVLATAGAVSIGAAGVSGFHQLVLVGLASLAGGVILWSLPAAMSVPSGPGLRAIGIQGWSR